MAQPNEMFSKVKKSFKERFYPIIDQIVENLLGHATEEVGTSNFGRQLKVTAENSAHSIEEVLDNIILDVIKFHNRKLTCLFLFSYLFVSNFPERTFVSILNEPNPESIVLNDGLPDLVGVKSEPINQVTEINQTDSLASSVMGFGVSTSSSPPAEQISVTSPVSPKRQMEQSKDDNSNKHARRSSLEPSISEPETMFVCHLHDCNATGSFADR